MKNLIKIIVVLNCAAWLFAQNGSISGTVSDADGNPLAGANVSVEGTSMGAATITSGAYSISGVPAGSYTVTASYIGYESSNQSVDVSAGSAQADFSLATSALAGADVFVTGTRAAGNSHEITYTYRRI